MTEEARSDGQTVVDHAAWPAVLTWRAHDAPRMESARVQFAGNRLKVSGRVVAAATDRHPAFSASYDLATDELGATKRLTVTMTLAERDRQVSIARDEEGMWLVQTHSETKRSDFGGALDVDVVFSPLFNTLPIRRLNLIEKPDAVVVPVVYVRMPVLSVEVAEISYDSTVPDGIKLVSPVADTTITADSDGFVLNYPGLAERI